MSETTFDTYWCPEHGPLGPINNWCRACDGPRGEKLKLPQEVGAYLAGSSSSEPGGQEREARWVKYGNASLGVRITNGPAVVVSGTGLTTEEAVEAVCSYLPVVPVGGGLSGLSDEEIEALIVATEGSLAVELVRERVSGRRKLRAELARRRGEESE